jgi:hypothetical protein
VGRDRHGSVGLLRSRLVGSIGASIWPAIIGWWLIRNRREKNLQKEVEKQVSEQGK